MTSNKCLKYNHASKPQKLIRMDGLTLTNFPSRLKLERFTSNQIIRQ